MSARTTIDRIRGSATVALECLKSAHTEKDARRYMQQVVDMIDVALALKEFESSPNMRTISEDQIKHMVDRFLGWKLPENFNPDDGISFDPVMNKGHEFESRREPTGTNLFDAGQATEMVRYMVEGMPGLKVTAAMIDAGRDAIQKLGSMNSDGVSECLEAALAVAK